MVRANRMNDLRRVLSDRGEEPDDKRLEALWKIADPLCRSDQAWQGLLTLIAAEKPNSKPTGVRVRSLAALAAKQSKPVREVRPASVFSTMAEAHDASYGQARMGIVAKIHALKLPPGAVADILEAIRPLFPAYATQIDNEINLYRKHPADWRDVADSMAARRAPNASPGGSSAA